MTVIATASNPRFWVSRVDIDRAGPTYTIDTLRDLHAALPDAELYFITGADALADIFTWRDVGRAVRARPVRRLYASGLRDGRRDAGQDPGRPGHHGRGAGAGDQLHGLSDDVRCGTSPCGTSCPTVSSSTSPSTTSTPSRLTSHSPPPKVLHDRHRPRRQPRPHRRPRGVRQAGQHIIAFDVSEQLAITDAFLLASASNDRQVKSIVDEIEDKLREIGAQADPSRGRARRTLGADRLRRHRRPRAARGGAAVLRPRTALARLPAHRAPRRRHRRPRWR